MIYRAAAANRGSVTPRWSTIQAAGAVAASVLVALCILAFVAQASQAATAPNCSNVQDPSKDSDGDYLSNLQECKGHFDKTWWDTDDDGLGDAFEDSDRDNRATHEEFKAGFDPLKAHSDATLEDPYGNGIRDDFEDTDGDGLDTWEEFSAQATLGSKSCGSLNFRAATLKPKTPSFSPRMKDSYTLRKGVCVTNGTKDAAEDIDREGKGIDIDGDGRSNELDGLTTAAEFDLSWDPNDPDTDGDYQLDGNEPGTGTEIGRRHHG